MPRPESIVRLVVLSVAAWSVITVLLVWAVVADVIATIRCAT